MEFYKSITKRFLKGFLAGGIGAMSALLLQGVMLNSLDELKALGISLATAFIAGGLLSVEKMLTWTDEPKE